MRPDSVATATDISTVGERRCSQTLSSQVQFTSGTFCRELVLSYSPINNVSSNSADSHLNGMYLQCVGHHFDDDVIEGHQDSFICTQEHGSHGNIRTTPSSWQHMTKLHSNCAMQQSVNIHTTCLSWQRKTQSSQQHGKNVEVRGGRQRLVPTGLQVYPKRSRKKVGYVTPPSHFTSPPPHLTSRSHLHTPPPHLTFSHHHLQVPTVTHKA